MAYEKINNNQFYRHFLKLKRYLFYANRKDIIASKHFVVLKFKKSMSFFNLTDISTFFNLSIHKKIKIYTSNRMHFVDLGVKCLHLTLTSPL